MENEFGVKVENDKIIVIDCLEEQMITIQTNKNVNLFINDVLCEEKKAYEVKSTDKITYTCKKTEAIRKADVVIAKDKMKAYVRIEYIPEIQYKLKDTQISLNLTICTEVVSEKYPELFRVEELKEILKEKGITYGIKEEQLKLAVSGTKEELLISEGKEPLDDKPSEAKLFFTPTKMIFPDPNSKENIDFKNLFRISNVSAGDKIAEIISERNGNDGINIFGKIIKRKYMRNKPINVSDGCKLQGNNVIALIDGKAHFENRTFTVNHIYSLDCVSMETGNIKFSGDIEIYDTVHDNMIVSSGGTLDVSKNVNTSKVISGGVVTIVGNVMNSKILSGQIEIRNKEYLDILNEFMSTITKIINHLNELKNNGRNIKDANLIRTLIEKNYSNVPKIALNIVCKNMENKIKRSRILDYIRENILGYNILNIKTVEDLIGLNNILEEEIEYYNKNIISPLDIRIGYCQDCEVKSTGNIIIGGKGEYTSKLIAMQDILFTRPDAVARGGMLSASKNISVGIVGSKAYASTILQVPENGTITAALAFENTTFCFGKASLTLEETKRNIKVYYDKDSRTVEIDRFIQRQDQFNFA